MKGDLEKQAEGPQHPEVSKETKLGNLPPHEQERLLKAEIGKRLKESELRGIRKMSLSEMNEVVDRDVDPPLEGSRLNRIRLMNLKMGVTDEMMEHNIISPGEKHLEMLEKSDALRRYKIAEYKKDPVMAQIKRGKLGMDNFFIFFSIFGAFMIPLYVFTKFRKHKQDIIDSRIASPEVIKNLDEDSPISLDDVSYHTIHYFNPDRIKEEDAKRKRVDDRQKL